MSATRHIRRRNGRPRMRAVDPEVAHAQAAAEAARRGPGRKKRGPNPLVKPRVKPRTSAVDERPDGAATWRRVMQMEFDGRAAERRRDRGRYKLEDFYAELWPKGKPGIAPFVAKRRVSAAVPAPSEPPAPLYEYCDDGHALTKANTLPSGRCRKCLAEKRHAEYQRQVARRVERAAKRRLAAEKRKAKTSRRAKKKPDSPWLSAQQVRALILDEVDPDGALGFHDSEKFLDSAILLVGMVNGQRPTRENLIRWSGIQERKVDRMLGAFYRSQIVVGEEFHPSDWLHKETGTVAFILDAGVGAGHFVRLADERYRREV